MSFFQDIFGKAKDIIDGGKDVVYTRPKKYEPEPYKVSQSTPSLTKLRSTIQPKTPVKFGVNVKPTIPTQTPLATANTSQEKMLERPTGGKLVIPSVIKAAVQGTARGALATEFYALDRIRGVNPESAKKLEFVPKSWLSKKVFGEEPVSVKSEAINPLIAMGASPRAADKYGVPLLFALTAADLVTGGGKKKLLQNALVGANDFKSARTVLKNYGLNDEAIKALKLETKVVGIKNSKQADEFVNQIEKAVENSKKVLTQHGIKKQMTTAELDTLDNYSDFIEGKNLTKDFEPRDLVSDADNLATKFELEKKDLPDLRMAGKEIDAPTPNRAGRQDIIPPKPPTPKPVSVSSGNLSIEAKKYKSAEDFVKAYRKNKVFHGTDNIGSIGLKDSVLKSGFKQDGLGKSSRSNPIFFTENRRYAKVYGRDLFEFSLPKDFRTLDVLNEGQAREFVKNATDKSQAQKIVDGAINQYKSGSDTWSYLDDSNFLDFIKEEGYDALRMVENRKGDTIDFTGELFNKDVYSHAVLSADEIPVTLSKTKSQLTDIYNKANPPKKKGILQTIKDMTPAERQGGFALAKPKEFPTKKPAPIKIETTTPAIRKAIKNKSANAEKIGELSTRIDIAEEALANDPARSLARYAGKDGLPEVTGKGKSVFSRKGDELADQAGFRDSEEAREAYSKYRVEKEAVKDLRDTLKPIKGERTLANKVSRVASTVSAERRSYIRFLQDQFQLTDGEIKKLTFGRDLQRMGESEFKGFVENMERRAVQVANTKQAKWELMALLEDKHFVKVDNYRKVQKLPTIGNMNETQLREYAKTLEQFVPGDEFLSPRTLETVSRTELGDVSTMREVREHLWNELKKDPQFTNLKLEDLENLKATSLDNWRYDTALAEKNPFYNLVVNRTQTEMMRGKASFLKIQDEINRLTVLANNSRKKTIFGKVKASVVPRQNQIITYLEATGDAKTVAMKNLTKEELDLASYMESYYSGALDHLVSINELRGSRYADAYFTHTKKQFLEKWSDDSFIDAVHDIFKSQKDVAQTAKIIDQDTGQILAKNKFFKYTLRRTGTGEPSQNATKVFLDYAEQMERKKMLDRIIPEIDVYTQALTPNKLTGKGLELDRSLKTFVNKYLNNKKGRRENFGGLIEQGGKLDVALRLGNTFVSLKDLAGNIFAGAATFVGEGVMTYQALGKKGLATAVKRRLWDTGLKGIGNPNASKILKEAEPFLGRNVWTELLEPNVALTDKALTGIFAPFAQASVESNKLFLLGRISKKELASGKLSPARLAELRLEAGRWRDMGSDVKSIYGATSGGATVNKYKGWAIPIARTNIKNLVDLTKRLKSGDFKGALTSREFQETYRAIELTTAIYFVGQYAMADVDQDTFLGKLYARIQLEALTIMGGVDPRMFVSVPRLVSFLEKLTENLVSLASLEKYIGSGKDYEEGDLKGGSALKRQFTPSFIKQFQTSKTSTGVKDLDIAIKSQSKEKETTTDKVETLTNELAKLSPEEAVTRLKELSTTDKPLALKVRDKLRLINKRKDWSKEDEGVYKLGVTNGARAKYVYNKGKAMGKEAGNAYFKEMFDKGVISKTVLGQIKELATTKTPVKTTTKERTAIETVGAYATAFLTDPGNAAKALFTKEELGKVEGNLVEMKRFYGTDFRAEDGSEAYIYEQLKAMGIKASERSNYNLEHIVPVSAGGDSSPSNLRVVTREVHNSYTPVDIALGKAVKGGTLTRKEASKLARDFKNGIITKETVYETIK